ncbi:hypothetical protein [Photobacterium leiognathi]|uniref:hypothetical protein n=1 Tax=Photobacterium leiognathi TaxID=553611 RepID=UPI0029819BF3|nr:hypothetical protein [Photobacterium leiognathi]
MDRMQFIDELIKLDFSQYKTKSKQWYGAYVLYNGKQVMCVLHRKNGVDIQVKTGNLDDCLELTEHGLLSISIDGLTRNFFNNSNCSLFDSVIYSAKCFKNRIYDHNKIKPIGNSFFNDSTYVKQQRKNKARQLKRQNDIKELKDKLDIAYSLLGYYPQDILDGLEELENQSDIDDRAYEKIEVIGEYSGDMLYGYHCR